MVEHTPYNMSDSIVCCDPEEVIFTETSYGDEMYIIRSGRVEISRMNEYGKQVLNVLEKGDFFGEMALLSDTPRTATATSIGPTTLLLLNKKAVVARIKSNPAFALNLLAGLSKRLTITTSRLMGYITAVEEHFHESNMACTQSLSDTE